MLSVFHQTAKTLAEKELFFSEEKKQKTFMSLSRIYPVAYAKDAKVFWFFFSKKNYFLNFLQQTDLPQPCQHQSHAGASPDTPAPAPVA
jgi:hypothetical protein